MKKTYLTLVFVVSTFSNIFSQQKISDIKNTKWYTQGNFKPENIILKPNTYVGSDAIVNFSNSTNLLYCFLVKTSFNNADGSQTKAGSYHCDSLYEYELNNNVLLIKYPLYKYSYNLKKLDNGDLELIYTNNK